MKLYTMGFTQKSAEEFFRKIKENHIRLLIDVRLNNQSQLAGFTKGRDLAYFLENLADCRYCHEPDFAPAKELLRGYQKGDITWESYEEQFGQTMETRKAEQIFRKKYASFDTVLLLCSEPGPERCHRRLLAERFAAGGDVEVVHI